MNVLLSKFKEVFSSVLPVVIFVIILNFTVVSIESIVLYQFLVGSFFIVCGLSILLLGIDLGFLPFGVSMGGSFVKSNKIWYIIIVSLLVGFFVNFAEPDMIVLATQVSAVSGGRISTVSIRFCVAAGAGIMVTFGVARIVKNLSLRVMLLVIYGIGMILAFFTSSDMLAIAFDASGAATGAVTVPLILALALGVASQKKDSKSAEEDSFGLVGVMASGAVLGVLILNLFIAGTGEGITGDLPAPVIDKSSLFGPFINHIPGVLRETVTAVIPITIMLFIFQKLKFHMPSRAFHRMLMGFIYAFIGLVLFFLGVHTGFMNLGNLIGQELAAYENKGIIINLSFFLGLLIVLTEPAVHILTHQIEEVTNGYIKRRMVLAFLAMGVACAVGLCMLKIMIPSIKIWHYLLPGFLISFILAFVSTPKMFIGMAFDSGAVASGPMTVTFILAFTQGAAVTQARATGAGYANVMADSFGVIALVAMMPIIAVQILGLIYRAKSKKSGV